MKKIKYLHVARHNTADQVPNSNLCLWKNLPILIKVFNYLRSFWMRQPHNSEFTGIYIVFPVPIFRPPSPLTGTFSKFIWNAHRMNYILTVTHIQTQTHNDPLCLMVFDTLRYILSSLLYFVSFFFFIKLISVFINAIPIPSYHIGYFHIFLLFPWETSFYVIFIAFSLQCTHTELLKHLSIKLMFSESINRL